MRKTLIFLHAVFLLPAAVHAGGFSPDPAGYDPSGISVIADICVKDTQQDSFRGCLPNGGKVVGLASPAVLQTLRPGSCHNFTGEIAKGTTPDAVYISVTDIRPAASHLAPSCWATEIAEK